MLYLVRDTVSGHIKIGHSNAPWRRMINLQIGTSARLEMAALIDGGAIEEAELHGRFEALRVGGEWFRCEGELEEYVLSLPVPVRPPSARKKYTDVLGKWMLENNETLKTLARKVGVSHAQISRIRCRLSRASPNTALKLQAVTGIPAEIFAMQELAA